MSDKKTLGGSMQDGIREDFARQVAALKKAGNPVFDKDGKEIGRTGTDAPLPVAPDGGDLILAAFRAENAQREIEIGKVLDVLGQVAWEADKARRDSNYLSFSTTLKIAEKLDALRVRWTDAKKQLDELESRLGPDLAYKGFRALVWRHFKEIEAVYTGPGDVGAESAGGKLI